MRTGSSVEKEEIYLSGQHSSVRGSLVTIGLDFHASGDTGDGFLAGQVCHMNEGVVEAGIDVSHAENNFSLTDLWAKRHLDFFFRYFILAWSHYFLLVATAI